MTPNLDRTFAALSDPTRRGVVDLLRKEPRRASDLADVLGASRPAMSRHLRVLRASGLVETTDDDTDDADARVAEVRNAGAVFVGPYAPTALGDYAAGANHVLPTGGAARFASALRVDDFRKHVHVVRATPEGSAALSRQAAVVAHVAAHGLGAAFAERHLLVGLRLLSARRVAGRRRETRDRRRASISPARQ